MKSMTGFGVGERVGSRGKIRVEVKSFNHRFLEIRVRLPRMYQGFESRLYSWIKNRIERGRVELFVQLAEYDKLGSSFPIILNRPVIEAYINVARQLKEEYGVNGNLDIRTLLSLHNIFQTPEEIEINDEDWIPLMEATEEALKAMDAMQKQEGDAISKDLKERIEVIESGLVKIEDIAKDLTRQFQERLERRVSQIFQDERIDPQRIAEEVVFYADKTDITEEIVRIRSHTKQLKQSISTSSMPGKRLEFLVQEIHREVNTMGTKSQDHGIIHLVVDMKTELEKIREQAQNLQ